jgi:regulator of cell morphogenesis and NO signaling
MNEQITGQNREVTGKTIGELVAADYRAARVFEKYGIDFCCGGRIPLATACRERGIDPDLVSREIEEAGSEPLERSQNYTAWGLPFLADYIINTHHAYLNENLGKISAYAHKIAQVHGARHPEVIEIARIFAKIATDMVAHLREEEDVLFPAIRRIDAAVQAGREPDAGDRETVKTSLAQLDREHEEIGDAVHTIRDLSNNYGIPDDVCNTFMLTYRMLKEFEDDLHKHVHLENNILFPKAAQL